MGFVGFLNFVLKCIQLLTWPSLALGYPLCASIRAIERNSNYHMRKLVTYWILFSLISLFEHAFEKLIEWVPFWPYMKILAVCWLVIPSFGGAYNAYKSIVRPCLSLHLLEVVINLLIKNQELSLKGETFLAVAERYINENGTEALEKLIAKKDALQKFSVEEIKSVAAGETIEVAALIQSNNELPNVAHNDINAVKHEANVAAKDKIQSNSKAPIVAQNDINAVEHEENVAVIDKIVKHVEANLSRTQQKSGTSKSMEVEEVTSTVTVRDYVLPVPPASRIRKEWTCIVCQFKTMSESTLNSHLQGRKHKSKCEKLKLSKQAEISNNKVPNVAQNLINAVEHEKNVAVTDKSSNNKAPNVAQNDINAVEHEENVAATDKISNNKVPNDAQNDIKAVEHEKNVASTDKNPSNNKAPNVAQNDINAVEHEENVTATDKIVKHVEANLSRTQHKLGTSKSTEVEEVTSTVTVKDYVLPVPPASRIRKEWTCVVCQFKTMSELTLNSHLQGRKHKSKCEKLKLSKQAEISNSKAPNLSQNNINAVEHEENVAATDKSSNIKAPNVAQNGINVVEHEENVAATDKSSNSKASNVMQNDINVVEDEENVAATDKIQSNNKVPNVAQNDINAVEHEKNVAATDKISNNKAPNVAQNGINDVEHKENIATTIMIQSNNKVPNVQNDINVMEHEENVAATDKIKLGTNKSTEVKEVISATTVRDYVLPVPPASRIQK